MSLSASILPEFDQEMSNLRKTLARVPDDKFDWKPHAKSNTMGWLVNHLANMPGWTVPTLTQDSLNLAPAGTAPYKEPQGRNAAAVLEILDKNIAAARSAIEAATDDQWMKPWKLLVGDRQIFELPRIAVLRGMILNHVIHHRGQLTVYFRLNDVPVPALYGPSADEGTF